MSMALDTILIQAVNDYIKRNPPQPGFSKLDLKHGILDETIMLIEGQNTMLNRGSRMKVPHMLANVQIARIVELVEKDVTCIAHEGDSEDDDDDKDMLAIYQRDGPNKGLYSTSTNALHNLFAEYNMAANKRDLDEVSSILKRRLPKKHLCRDRDLIAVNNGLFNYKAKQLMPFDPEKVFLTKSKVNYNPNATNILIYNPSDNTVWDVESWVASLSFDKSVCDLLWQIIGAVVRPLVSWNKSAFLYSVSGNSGKGTLCELMRQLCGPGSYVSISLGDFCKEFRLEELLHAMAVIVDENDVGQLVDRAAAFKSVVSGDVLQINRKNKTAITFRPKCFVVQCINELPRITDKSNSLYRRVLLVPFEKCFTGQERKYIKDDYLKRPEVLEYVLYKVLNMPSYYELDEPDACKALMGEYKEFNNPIEDFLNEMLPRFRWDLIPEPFMFNLYKEWMKVNCPSGRIANKTTFNAEVKEIVRDNANWCYAMDDKGHKKDVRVSNRMDAFEPLVTEYNLDKEWAMLRSSDGKRFLKPKYKGLVRRGSGSSGSPSNDDD